MRISKICGTRQPQPYPKPLGIQLQEYLRLIKQVMTGDSAAAECFMACNAHTIVLQVPSTMLDLHHSASTHIDDRAH